MTSFIEKTSHFFEKVYVNRKDKRNLNGNLLKLAKRKLIVRIKPELPVKYLQVGQKEHTLLVILLELGPLMIPWGSFIVFEIFKVLKADL